MAGAFSDADLAPGSGGFSDSDVAVDHAEAPGLGQQLSDFFGHTWNGVSGAVSGTASAIRHPLDAIDAAHAELTRSADEIQKGKDAWKAGDHSKALAHWKLAVPVMGPMSQQMGEEEQRGEGGAEAGDFLGFMGGAKLLHEASKAVPKIPGAVRGAASGVKTAAEATAEAVKNPANAVGNMARTVPEPVSTGLSKVEKAVTLSPAAQDAIKILPGGSNIVGAANTIGRGARTAQRFLKTGQRLGAEAPAEPARLPSGVAYPGAQDPAAIEQRTPNFDMDLTPEQEAARAARAPQAGAFSDADVAPTQTETPAAVPETQPAIPETQPAVPASETPAETPAAPEATAKGKFALKPGEGTHLDLQLKEGEVPTAKDYQAQARKVWAGHMATRLNAMGVNAETFGQMTQADVDTLAKDIGIKASSPEKIALVMDKLQSQPNVTLPDLGKATKKSAAPTRKPAKRAPKAPSTAEHIGGQLMGD